MLDSTYIEDTFMAMGDLILSGSVSYQPQDYKPILSFRTIINNGDLLTEKQGKFILILIGKYKKQVEQLLQVSIDVETLKWRNSFRVIDYSKSLEIDSNDSGYPCAVMKFPYNLKDEFEKRFGNNFPYNHNNKTREVALLDVNPIDLLDFCNQHKFKISNDFIDYVEKVEEVWSSENDIIPYSIIENDHVHLVNASKSAEEYFFKNKHNNIDKDIFLARQLGFPLKSEINSPIFNLCSDTSHTHFWTDSFSVVADLLAKLDLEKVVIVLDRQSNVQEFIEEMIDNLTKQCYNIDNIRVCFRGANNNDEGKEFNKWIKMKGIGGKIETGKIFIFKHTVAKWAKKSDFVPQLMVSNSIYEPTNVSTRNFLKSCHARITVSDVVPTTRKEDKIAKL